MKLSTHITEKPKKTSAFPTNRFIVLEGIDGAGKSTQLPVIRSFFASRGEKVATTSEPAENTKSGEFLRNFIAEKNFSKTEPLSQLMFFFAARREHIVEFIKPKLKQGFWVVCDRFVHSSYAYQGSLNSRPDCYLDKFDIDYLARLICADCQPGLVMLFDISAKVARKRKEQQFAEESDKSANCFDAANVNFHKRARAEYLRLADSDPDRWQIISASQTKAKVASDIYAALNARFYGGAER